MQVFLSNFMKEYEQANRAAEESERDDWMIKQINSIRHGESRGIRDYYTKAFNKYGINISTLNCNEAAAQITSRKIKNELASALTTGQCTNVAKNNNANASLRSPKLSTLILGGITYALP